MSSKLKICAEPGCRNVQTTKGYCRLHYLKNWKQIKQEGQKKAAERLNRYVEGICKKYPDRYLEMIRKNLRGERDFSAPVDEAFSHDEVDDILHDLGIPDEDNLDKLLSNLKIEKAF